MIATRAWVAECAPRRTRPARDRSRVPRFLTRCGGHPVACAPWLAHSCSPPARLARATTGKRLPATVTATRAYGSGLEASEGRRPQQRWLAGPTNRLHRGRIGDSRKQTETARLGMACKRSSVRARLAPIHEFPAEHDECRAIRAAYSLRAPASGGGARRGVHLPRMRPRGLLRRLTQPPCHRARVTRDTRSSARSGRARTGAGATSPSSHL